jgi:hypothetical protein
VVKGPPAGCGTGQRRIFRTVMSSCWPKALAVAAMCSAERTEMEAVRSKPNSSPVLALASATPSVRRVNSWSVSN